MVGYGIGNVDLNLRAQLALLGFSERVEEDLAALLRSSQPIESETINRLADALEGKGRVVLYTKGKKASKLANMYLKRRERLRVGRAIRKEVDRGTRWDIAIAYFADELNGSDSKAEGCHTFAQRCDDWIAEHAKRTSNAYTAQELEAAFVYADITKSDPGAEIKDTLPGLAKAFEALGSLRAAADGRPRPKLKP
jgi:hypothetical protein